MESISILLDTILAIRPKHAILSHKARFSKVDQEFMRLLKNYNLSAKVYSSDDLDHGEILNESNWPKEADEELIWTIEIEFANS